MKHRWHYSRKTGKVICLRRRCDVIKRNKPPSPPCLQRVEMQGTKTGRIQGRVPNESALPKEQ